MIGKKIYLLVFICLFGHLCISQPVKERLIILADMGHDPDEEQQIIHMLTRSNHLDLEGLIAVTGRFFRPDPTDTVKDLRPYLFHDIINSYAEVYPNLLLHAEGWPSPEHLHSIVANGQIGNGMKDVWAGNSSLGSQMIIESVIKKDPRPINIVINAGANTLAQALIDYKFQHTKEELQAFVAKMRVYDNSGQDDAGAWICSEFPEIFWIRSIAQNRCFGGPSNTNLGPHCWKPFAYSPEGQHAWVNEHVQMGHGALGAAYPDRTVGTTTHYLEGGGTIPLLAFGLSGLNNISEPSWGGWGGRFSSEKLPNVSSAFSIIHSDEQLFEPYKMYSENLVTLDRWIDPSDSTVYHNVYTSSWRWRQAMWNDFRARMDWCIASFEKANHHPIAVVNGDHSGQILRMNSKPEQLLEFDASDSKDPDGDALFYSWWFYPEAGNKPYLKSMELKKATSSKIQFEIPKDARGTELHLILEVSDDHKEVPLVDYRRIVIEIEKNH